MQKIFLWIKSNKLTFVLILAVLFLLTKSSTLRGIRSSTNRYVDYGKDSLDTVSESASMGRGGGFSSNLPIPNTSATPHPEVEERMKVKNASISLHVKDIKESVTAINTYVENIGGYVVTQRINTPQESSTGYMTVRVPSDKLEASLEYFGERAIRVVQEEITGRDITDKYVDTQAQLATLERTKAIFEGILDEAVEFDDILRANREILSTQSQIDYIKGRLQYMEKTSETSLINITMSTDELELGYAPADAWRPKVVLKKAVRSLVSDVRGLGETAIWIGVYSVFWIPALIIVLVVKKVLKNRKSKSKVSKK